MSSKAIGTGGAEATSDILVLINLIRTATEFKADMKEMATICNISHEKNVPRKINAVIAPYGFKFERGRIIEHAGGVSDKGQGNGAEKAVKTPTKTTKPAAKTPKGNTPKSNKRRKIEEEEEEPNEIEAGVAGSED